MPRTEPSLASVIEDTRIRIEMAQRKASILRETHGDPAHTAWWNGRIDALSEQVQVLLALRDVLVARREEALEWHKTAILDEDLAAFQTEADILRWVLGETSEHEVT